MRVAIVGCGFVAPFYVQTLPNYPQLELAGVIDRDEGRAEGFARHFGLHRYPSLAALLADRSVELLLNLTNPASHYAVSRAALDAGKHVYSEKPLALELGEARELVELAERRGLQIASAPCSLLGEAAQTLWRALRRGAAGPVRLAYAELDDGPVHQMGYQRWVSEAGSPWPAADEFATGCTLEHAGYYLTWLCAFFGPAHRVTSFAACLVPDKGLPLQQVAPDFTTAAIEFAGGVVARFTCGIVAPHDHRLRLVGDDGVLAVDDCWYYGAPVSLERRTALALKAERFPLLKAALGRRVLPLARPSDYRHRYRTRSHQMDFARGVAEVADAVREGRPCRLGGRFSLHVNELTLAIQYPQRFGTPYTLTTSFAPVVPMPWAS